MSKMEDLPFLKMHGLGNDFIVLDGRDGSALPDSAQMKALADRHKGIGCDQLMVLMPPIEGADVVLDMYNADGSIAGACGNGTRCVASLIMAEKAVNQVVIRTIAGDLPAWRDIDGGDLSVQMGPVHTGWQDIPLSRAADTAALDLGLSGLGPATAVSVGNPHAVFFVEDAEGIDVEKWGAEAETHPIFADRANIEFVQLFSRREIRMRVWERGVGITMACGSGACASVAASVLRGLTDPKVTAHLDGGTLEIDWRDAGAPSGGQIIMTGPVSQVASGIIPAAFFASLTAEPTYRSSWKKAR
jgi:diaminopimelate epimerase